MTIGTLVIIVLAILVLVVLVVGFTGGWGSLWDKIKNLFGGEANVDTIKQACASVCLTKSEYDYCSVERSLKYLDTDGKTLITVTGTCEGLSEGTAKDGTTVINNLANNVRPDPCEIGCGTNPANTELENCINKDFGNSVKGIAICEEGAGDSGAGKCKTSDSAGNQFKDVQAKITATANPKLNAVCCKSACLTK